MLFCIQKECENKNSIFLKEFEQKHIGFKVGAHFLRNIMIFLMCGSVI